MEQLIATPVKTPELILGRWPPIFSSGSLTWGFRHHGRLSVRGALQGEPVPPDRDFRGLSVRRAEFRIIISIITKSHWFRARSPWSRRTFRRPPVGVHVFNFKYGETAPGLTRIVPGKVFCGNSESLFLKGSSVRFLIADAVFLLAFA